MGVPEFGCVHYLSIVTNCATYGGYIYIVHLIKITAQREE